MIRSEKTRQFIIEKTASIFNKKGYIGTYLSDLTNATGLTKGSIYGNFKDKNEVAVEAFRYNFGNIAHQVNSLVDPETHAIDKLLGFVTFYRQEFQNVFANGGCAILNTATDADDVNDQLKTEACKALQKWKNKIIRILEEGMQQGEVKNVNAPQFANKMIALIEGTIMMAKVLNEYEIMHNNLDCLQSEIEALRKT